jgi:hypothetical protein
MIYVEVTSIHYGKGEENPVLFMRFYSDGRGRADGREGGREGGRALARQVSPQQVRGKR